MMQIPSSNSASSLRSSMNLNNYKGGGKKKPSMVVRWLDGIIDKACINCAPAGYAVGDEVDDNSVAYNSTYDEDENDSDMYMSRPHRNNKNNNSDGLWEAAEDSIQWFKSYTGHTLNVQQQQQPMSFDEARERSHENTRKNHRHRHHDRNLSSPASDCTATTIMTDATSCSQTTAPARGTSSTHNHHKAPAVVTPSKSSGGRRFMTAKDRAHSTGTMMSPEDEFAWDENHDQNMISPSSSMMMNREQRTRLTAMEHADSMGSTSSSNAVCSLREVPYNNGMAKRVRSDTLQAKLPFQTLSQGGYLH